MFAVLVLLMAGLVSSDIICPDGTTCQDKNTCCSTDSGYACCHYPNAICCADKANCCPQGYVCDLQFKMCVKERLPWYRFPLSPQKSGEEMKEKILSPPKESTNVSASSVRCDTYYSCPDGTTCCKSPQGKWTCCPYSMGQCCRDGYHCCPHGTYCDPTSTYCQRGDESQPSSDIPAKFNFPTQISVEELEEPLSPPKESTSLSASSVRCDSYYTCPDGTTCCKSPQGTWTCCPFSMGQCCRDGYHCCPHGSYCDPTSTYCQHGDQAQPSVHIPAMLIRTVQKSAEESEEKSLSSSKESMNVSASSVRCDTYYSCPDGTTCCKSPQGKWTCCPYSMGQCCRDGYHCCPHGTYCDPTSTYCQRGDESQPSSDIPAKFNFPTQISVEELEEPLSPPKESTSLSASSVRCDSYYTCPDGTTCCKSPQGTWTCCPYSMGQCCRDGYHCCPHGTYCDPTSTYCQHGDESQPSSDIPAKLNFPTQISLNALSSLKESTSLSASSVRCDSYYTCPDGTTCCKSPQGTWTCCPFSMGQCCRDGYHCCPHGSYCDPTSTYCHQGDERWLSYDMPALLAGPAKDQCCLSETGCCPVGFRCDEKSRACVVDFEVPSALLPPEQDSENQIEAVIRCNGLFYCPAGNTCCRTPTGQWGCCPFPLGQCCKDGKHCCRYKYSCDATFSKCNKGFISIPASVPKKAMIL